jgi:hypothetical protein
MLQNRMTHDGVKTFPRLSEVTGVGLGIGRSGTKWQVDTCTVCTWLPLISERALRRLCSTMARHLIQVVSQCQEFLRKTDNAIPCHQRSPVRFIGVRRDSPIWFL